MFRYYGSVHIGKQEIHGNVNSLVVVINLLNINWFINFVRENINESIEILMVNQKPINLIHFIKWMDLCFIIIIIIRQ